MVTADTDDGPNLIDALAARRGIVCLVGAGGKKTTMVRLSQQHPGRVALTATTRVPFRLKRESVDLLSLPEDIDAAEAARRLGGPGVVGFAGQRTRNYRLAGLEPQTIADIHNAAKFDATYVKADGARLRLAKAHKPGEPSLVPGTSTVLLFASVQAIGKTIDDEAVHHAELFAEAAGLDVGDAMGPEHLARVMQQQVQLLRGTGDVNVIPVINMADDDALLQVARETAEVLWQGAPDIGRIAITAMIQPEPLKDLLTR